MTTLAWQKVGQMSAKPTARPVPLVTVDGERLNFALLFALNARLQPQTRSAKKKKGSQIDINVSIHAYYQCAQDGVAWRGVAWQDLSLSALTDAVRGHILKCP